MGKFTPLDTTSPVHGDAELAERFLSTLGKRRVYALAIVEATQENTRTVTVGAEHDGTFELGSLTMAINGHILATMVADGTVSADQPLGSLLPLGECPASAVTLEALATHTSGLPAHGGSRFGTWRKALRAVRGRESDGETVEDVYGELRRARLHASGYRYSTLSGAALGHALAAADGTSYPALVRGRFATPLALPTALVQTPEGAMSQRDVPGVTFSGRPADPWTGPGYAPAGGIRASADDMAPYLDALVAHSAPGMDALSEWLEIDDRLSLGAFWHISRGEGRSLTWHNGETGGFSSWIGVDRSEHRALMISCAGHIDLDGTAAAMLLAP